MGADYSHLQRLIALAKEPSGEKRRALLREVTELFLARPEGYSEQEKEHFGEIMGRVAFDMETAVRKHLAQSLAKVPQAPHGLIAQLAGDAIEVAQPVLLQSPVLKDQDLVAIAGIKGQEHLKAIAGRPHLSEAVSEAVVARGDDAAFEALVRNETARIPRGAMERVIARAAANDKLQAPIVSRKDLPHDLLNEMFFVVSSQLRRLILERNSEIDEAAVDAALRESLARALPEIVARDDDEEAAAFIAERIRDRTLNEHLLVQLLRTRQVPEFVIGFAELTGLDPQTARRIFYDASYEAMAVACKASRFDRASFSTFVLLADPERTRSVEETYELLSLYDKVPVEVAQRTMRFWRVRKLAQERKAKARAA